jgi:uncharacterized protein
MKRRLIIFVKNPILGKVKTRLATTEGDENALEMYLQLLQHTATIAHDLKISAKVEKHIYYSTFIELDYFVNADQHFIQVDGDLGAKMHAAFEEGFSLGYEQQLIIGSDCAEIDAADLEKAFTALNFADIVLGPANDGGYYTLGLSKMVDSIFIDKPWSEPNLFTITQEEILKQGHGLFLLPTKSDVDTIADWNRSENLILQKV